LAYFVLHTECDHWEVVISSWTSYTSVEGDDAANDMCGWCLCMVCGFNDWEWEIANTNFENSENDEDNGPPDEDTNSKSIESSGGHGWWKQHVKTLKKHTFIKLTLKMF